MNYKMLNKRNILFRSWTQWEFFLMFSRFQPFFINYWVWDGFTRTDIHYLIAEQSFSIILQTKLIKKGRGWKTNFIHPLLWMEGFIRDKYIFYQSVIDWILAHGNVRKLVRKGDDKLDGNTVLKQAKHALLPRRWRPSFNLEFFEFVI